MDDELKIVSAHPGFAVVGRVHKEGVIDHLSYDPVVAWAIASSRPIPITLDGPSLGKFLAIRRPDGRIFFGNQGLTFDHEAPVIQYLREQEEEPPPACSCDAA